MIINNDNIFISPNKNDSIKRLSQNAAIVINSDAKTEIQLSPCQIYETSSEDNQSPKYSELYIMFNSIIEQSILELI